MAKTSKILEEELSEDVKRLMREDMPLTPNSQDFIRKRPGYHQTWLSEDMIEWAKEVGYSNVQRPKEGDPKRPGAETGEALWRSEGDRKRSYAMEVPEPLYQVHIHGVARRSHAAYTNPDLLAAEKARGTDRDLGAIMEENDIKVIATYEQQAEPVEIPDPQGGGGSAPAMAAAREG